MSDPHEQAEAAATAFAEWAHVHGYTGNPAISLRHVELMAQAWVAGCMYGLAKALELTEASR